MTRCGDLYVVCCGTPGHPIKIGASGQVPVRIRALSCPVCGEKPLKILLHAPGEGRTEGLLHRTFYQLHEGGEWFKDSPQIRLFVDHLKALNPEHVNQTIQLGASLISVPPFWDTSRKKLEAVA